MEVTDLLKSNFNEYSVILKKWYVGFVIFKTNTTNVVVVAVVLIIAVYIS